MTPNENDTRPCFGTIDNTASWSALFPAALG